MATGNRHVIEAVGRHPATGAVCQCVAVALTDSGLMIEMVNDDGQRILIHRYAWNAVKQAVDQLLVTRQAEAVAEAAQTPRRMMRQHRKGREMYSLTSETTHQRSGYTPIEDAEQRLQNEMVDRIRRAADELNAALHALCNVIVTKPQQGDPYQWRWVFSNALNNARRATNEGRFG